MDTVSYRRLKEHRVEFLKQERKGPLLSYGSLKDHEKLFMARRVFRAIGDFPDRDPYQLFSETLYEWGIMCPHPVAKRENRVSYHQCRACGALVIDFGQLNDDDDVSALVKKGAK
jgi:hypothetical protein